MAGVSSAQSSIHQSLEAMHERGQKLSELGDKSAKLADDAEDFASMAKQLRRQQEKGIFGSLFGGGKRKASQPADASGRAAAMSSRTGPGPSSWTGPPPRDPKEWRGPHNATRSRGNANPDASRQPSVVDLTREKPDHPSSSSPRAARAAARLARALRAALRARDDPRGERARGASARRRASPPADRRRARGAVLGTADEE